MQRLSLTYRFLAVAALTGMVWGLAAPVVHLACAMGSEPARIHCEGEAATHEGAVHVSGVHESSVYASSVHTTPARQTGVHERTAHEGRMPQHSAHQPHERGRMVPCPGSDASDISCCIVEAAAAVRLAAPASANVQQSPQISAADVLSSLVPPASFAEVPSGDVRGSPPRQAPTHLDFSVFLL